MHSRSMPLRICAWLAFWPLLTSAATEPARLPYDLIYQIQKTEATLGAKFTNLYMYLGMSSTLPQVGLRDLAVYIDANEGRIPVAINQTNGTFTVPMRDGLLAERPLIVVNQPKGTMNLEWYVGLRVSDIPTNSTHYGQLMRPLKDLEVIRNEMRKIPGSPDLEIYGLKMIYAPDKEASVVIHASGGERVLKTDETHSLVVPYDPALLAEDPFVSIPIPPLRVDVANPPASK